MNDKKLAVLGGDKRQAALAAFLADRGFLVYAYNLPSELLPRGVTLADSLDVAMDGAAAIILPLPVSGDGIYLSCPFSTDKDNLPQINDILTKAGNREVLGGRFSPRIREKADMLGVRLTDYFDIEELKIRNSMLTSEGALCIAMNTLEVSIAGSKSAVIGYGRLGKALAPMLKNMGSDVTVAARRSSDIAWAAAYGFNTLKIRLDCDGVSTLKKLGQGYDVIFNTVPSWVLDGRVLSGFSRETLIIDLASAPGGVDPSAAKEAGINVITALSIPGKYAPISAGQLIGEYIIEVLEKL